MPTMLGGLPLLPHRPGRVQTPGHSSTASGNTSSYGSVGGLPLRPAGGNPHRQFESRWVPPTQPRVPDGMGLFGGLPLRRYRDLIDVPPPPAAKPVAEAPTHPPANQDLWHHMFTPRTSRTALDFLRAKARGYEGGFNSEYLRSRGYR